MPRPTAAQVAYGSATVVFSTSAMLLLSQTRTGLGAVVIATAALGLGLFVALTAPLPGGLGRESQPHRASRTARSIRRCAPSESTSSQPGSGANASVRAREEHPLHR